VNVSEPAVMTFDRLRTYADCTDADGCWEWKRGKSSGYGRVRVGGKRGQVYRAHRLAYELVNGPIPDGAVVMHACDNPPCINPAHLIVGTQGENIADRDLKGHGWWTRKKGTP